MTLRTDSCHQIRESSKGLQISCRNKTKKARGREVMEMMERMDVENVEM